MKYTFLIHPIMKNTFAIALSLFLFCFNSHFMAQETSFIPSKPEDISPLLIGENIPNATLKDANGKPFYLKKAIAEKLSVLIFYRGGWCPYCSLQLSGLQKVLPNIEKMGYRLIAISTDAPEELNKSQIKEKLSYTLLSDADVSLSKKFGIAFKAPKNYASTLSKASNGKNVDLLLPVPSVFIINKNGEILFEYISPNYKHRLNPNLLLKVAQEIKLNN